MAKDILIVLLVGAVAASLTSAIYGLVRLLNKILAERKFIHKVVATNALTREMRSTILSDLLTEPQNPEKFADARQYFEKALEGLEKQYKEEIESGLSQSSTKGQKAYMVNLITRIGMKAESTSKSS